MFLPTNHTDESNEGPATLSGNPVTSQSVRGRTTCNSRGRGRTHATNRASDRLGVRSNNTTPQGSCARPTSNRRGRQRNDVLQPTTNALAAHSEAARPLFGLNGHVLSQNVVQQNVAFELIQENLRQQNSERHLPEDSEEIDILTDSGSQRADRLLSSNSLTSRDSSAGPMRNCRSRRINEVLQQSRRAPVTRSQTARNLPHITRQVETRNAALQSGAREREEIVVLSDDEVQEVVEQIRNRRDCRINVEIQNAALQNGAREYVGVAPEEITVSSVDEDQLDNNFNQGIVSGAVEINDTAVHQDHTVSRKASSLAIPPGMKFMII